LKYNWIIDLENASLSIGTIKQVKDMFSKLGQYYTERLGCCLVFNYGWTINAIWAFVKLFLDPTTAAKYKFIGYKKEFLDVVDENQLLEEYGGKIKFKFDTKLFEKEEKKDEEKKDDENIEEKKE